MPASAPIWRRSPNHGRRPDGVRPWVIVLHADASGSEEGTLGWLCDPASKVSYHYLVGRDGTVYQCVAEQRRAWHAGVSHYAGHTDVNGISIGVSFSNRQDGEAFPPAQIAAGGALVADLCARWGIDPAHITTHAEVAPGRKHDPGPLFPLGALVRDVRARLANAPRPAA